MVIADINELPLPELATLLSTTQAHASAVLKACDAFMEYIGLHRLAGHQIRPRGQLTSSPDLVTVTWTFGGRIYCVGVSPDGAIETFRREGLRKTRHDGFADVDRAFALALVQDMLREQLAAVQPRAQA